MKPILKYVKRWYVFLICMLLSVSFAAGYIYITTPYYFVSTTLMLQDDKKGDGVLKESAFSDLNMFHSTKTIDNEIQVLRSTNIMKKVLEKSGITTRIFLDKGILKEEVYGSSSPLKINVFVVEKPAYTRVLKISILNGEEFELGIEGGRPLKKYHFGERIMGPGFVISVDKSEQSLRFAVAAGCLN